MPAGSLLCNIQGWLSSSRLHFLDGWMDSWLVGVRVKSLLESSLLLILLKKFVRVSERWIGEKESVFGLILVDG